jgi:hypothetical protein
MGYTRTPKYRIELADRVMQNPMAWTGGRATQANLEKYIFVYAKGLEAGGVNEHIAKALGYVPYPTWARVVKQATGEVMAEWKAATFQVYETQTDDFFRQTGKQGGF